MRSPMPRASLARSAPLLSRGRATRDPTERATCTLRYYTMLYYAMLYYAMLYYANSRPGPASSRVAQLGPQSCSVVGPKCVVWLRTHGVNTNGVTAKVLCVDGFEQVLKMYVWDMTQFCMQPSPSSFRATHTGEHLLYQCGL